MGSEDLRVLTGASRVNWEFLSALLDLDFPDIGIGEVVEMIDISINEAMVVLGILEEYEMVGSYLKVALNIPGYSPTGVKRVVKAASLLGVIDVEIRTGRPKIDRGEVLGVVERYPKLSRANQARSAEVSMATLYRANRGE